MGLGIRDVYARNVLRRTRVRQREERGCRVAKIKFYPSPRTNDNWIDETSRVCVYMCASMCVCVYRKSQTGKHQTSNRTKAIYANVNKLFRLVTAPRNCTLNLSCFRSHKRNTHRSNSVSLWFVVPFKQRTPILREWNLYVQIFAKF